MGEKSVAKNRYVKQEIEQSDIDVTIYPNPVKDYLKIVGVDKSSSIKVFTKAGKLVLEQAQLPAE